MLKSIKTQAACLVVNTVLSSVKGVLDLSFGNPLYTKYGLKDEKGLSQPLGAFDATSLEGLLSKLKAVAPCSGWESIKTFQFNNQSLEQEHIPFILSFLTILPTFRPSVIELKGTDVAVIAELSPMIQALYGKDEKPKLIVVNTPPNAAAAGATSGGRRSGRSAGKRRKTRKHKSRKAIYRRRKNTVRR